MTADGEMERLGTLTRTTIPDEDHESVNEAVLAIETAREYLRHVCRWTAGRRSFGCRMIDNPVLRQRLAWAIVEISAADVLLGQSGNDLRIRCAAAVSAADRCVAACEQVHAAAGVFDPRPGVVHEICARHRLVGAEAPNARNVLGQACPALVGRVRAIIAATWPGASGEIRSVTAAGARRLISELDQFCPPLSTTLRHELALAETLALALPPGLTARALVHRNVVRTYLTGPVTAPIAAELRADVHAGQLLTAIAITEPQAGSDLAGLTCAVSESGGVLRLDGVKTYVTGGQDADAVLVAARSGPDIALTWVMTLRAGIRRRPLGDAAWPGAGFAELTIDSYPLSPHDLHPGSGTSALIRGLATERLMVAGQQLSYARHWLVSVPDCRRPELALRVEAAQALLLSAASDSQAGEPSLVLASMAKLACCAVAIDVADARVADIGGTANLVAGQASARAASFAGGTADLNLAIVEGKIPSLLSAGSGGQR